MTEAKWLNARHPYLMLVDKACRSDRKRRLLVCACARRVYPLIGDDPVILAIIEETERFADGQTSWVDLRSLVRRGIGRPHYRDLPYAATCAISAALTAAARQLAEYKEAIEYGQDARHASVTPDAENIPPTLRMPGMGMQDANKRILTHPAWTGARAEEAKAQCGLVLDLFGNPFRPSTIDRSRLGPDAEALARAIYVDRAFDRMPILGDALEEAGCADGQALDHCRSGSEHARGCWVVDAILGFA